MAGEHLREDLRAFNWLNWGILGYMVLTQNLCVWGEGEEEEGKEEEEEGEEG